MTKDQAQGMFIGLAVGDALGTFLEFGPGREPDNYLRDYTAGGPFDLPAGYWTDDTSMALAMADAIIRADGQLLPTMVLNNWISWEENGKFSSNGTCFDIGMTCASALRNFKRDRDPESCGLADEYSAGNGALMRMAPVIIAARDEEQAVDWALHQTRLTHASQLCKTYSEAFARELYRGEALSDFQNLKLPRETPREEVKSGGFVKETYECAWWALQNSDNFEDALVLAVNRGHDADTVGAVTGQIAGRIYGYSQIPERWIEGLHQQSHLCLIAKKLRMFS